MTNTKTFIPLGSAIKIDDDENVYVIISRAFMRTEEGGIIAGYQAILYPHGYGKQYKIQIIREDQITEVVTKGYADDREQGLIKDRLEELEKRMQEQKNNPQGVISNASQEVKEEELLLQDPFYKFKK